jgi:ribonuclease P protein component
MIHFTHRFHGRSSLHFVYQHGRAVRGELLNLRFVRNTRQTKYRAAVVVSRKISKSAVVRNRIRRRIFEIVRRESERFDGPYDLLFSVRSEELAQLDSQALNSLVTELLRQAHITKPIKNDIITSKES